MSECKEEILAEFLVFGENEDNHKWTHQNTLAFLELYKRYRDQVGSLKIKNLKKMYIEIARELELQTKTRISPNMCENRWKVLERNYKKFVDNSNLTGRGRKVFEYAEVMHSILGKKKNIFPVFELSSKTISMPEVNTIQEKENVEDRNSIIETPVMKKTKPVENNKRLKFNILKEIRADRNNYYKKKLELDEKKLLEKKRRNDLLEANNALLEKLINKNCCLPNVNV